MSLWLLPERLLIGKNPKRVGLGTIHAWGLRQLSSRLGDGGAVSSASRQFRSRTVHHGLRLRLREAPRPGTPMPAGLSIAAGGRSALSRGAYQRAPVRTSFQTFPICPTGMPREVVQLAAVSREFLKIWKPKRRVVDCDSDVPIVVEIDKQVERYRELLRSLTEQVEVERINQLIARLYADRVRLHRNPEQ